MVHMFHELLFLSFRRVLNVIYSFLGNSPASWVLIADVSELTIGSIFIGRWMKYSPPYEDGTDSEFRNVGN